MEGASPARLIEEMHKDMAHKAEAVANAGLIHLIVRCLERPVDKQRPAEDVLFRHKSPVTSVQAFRAVVAHGKDLARWNHKVAILNMIGQVKRPACSYLVHRAGRHRGEVI